MMKAIAFYLPQFHEVEENSRWWGEGYTEWVGVRGAKPLYPGHYQPTEPLNDNYYDLMDPKTLMWQAKLAKENGIYAFCFYHYWFSGKLILEKPAEMLLKQKEIDIHFCFSWANETWTRTWEIKGNAWNIAYDDKAERKDNGILIEQKYGNRDEWREHFMYLLPFFQDERYIKIDNKPVFLFYKIREIECLNSMLKMWNQLAVEQGFDGIYIIATNDCDIQNKYITANAIFEPPYLWAHSGRCRKIVDEYAYKKYEKGKKFPRIHFYQYEWKRILRREFHGTRKTFLGGFVNFDKTPREGKKALLYVGASPRRFKKFFNKLVQKANKLGDEFVFLNAWNEWGEGAYLEPDKKYGTKYLDAVRKVMESVSKEK